MALLTLPRRWGNRLIGRASMPAAMRQSGAIPYTIVKDQPVFLIITSRRTGRWIFPKGTPIEGMTPWEVAATEAFEEAGVEGEIETTPIGSYQTAKMIGIRRTLIEVDMYPLRVQTQREDWPEKDNRHRHWVILPDAKRLLSDARLVELAAALAGRVASDSQPAMGRISR